MSTTSHRPMHEADSWWGEPDPGAAVISESPRAAARERAARRRERARRPWWVRLLRAPFVLFARAVRSSPKLRTALVRLAVVAVVSLMVLGSVGVILINNVVIHRTAELGKLDQERRELRRDNAVLDAQAAKKSSQTLIVRRAEQLGMKRSMGGSTYIYLDPQSADSTAVLAARAKRAQRLAAAGGSTQ